MAAVVPLIASMDRWTARFSRLLMVIAALWAFALAFYVLVDVTFRAIGMPLAGAPEVIRASIVMIAYMQLAYCVVSRSMLRADFVLHMIGPRVQRVINFIGYVLGAGVFALVCYGSFEPTVHAWVTGDFDGAGALRMPIWPSQLTVFLTSALVAFNYLVLAAKELVELPDVEEFV